jgi:hypothetical protein
LKREGAYDSLPETGDNSSVKRKVAIRSLKFEDERDLVLGTMMIALTSLRSNALHQISDTL